MSYKWSSYTEQVQLLTSQGMNIPDPEQAALFLSQVSLARLNGYLRYWRQQPEHRHSPFLPGTSFQTVQDLFQAEQQLLDQTGIALRKLELLLRNRFAYSYSQKVGVTGTFLTGQGFDSTDNQSNHRIAEQIITALERSNENFIATHRETDETADVRPAVEIYKNVPIWDAVEVLSFGALSRLIAASEESGVLEQMATLLNAMPKHLPGQVRALVYLRNRIAHCMRVWNQPILEPPVEHKKLAIIVKKNLRDYDPRSAYRILVVMDDLLRKAGITQAWLVNEIEPILKANPLLAQGITAPQKYGHIPQELLLEQ